MSICLVAATPMELQRLKIPNGQFDTLFTGVGSASTIYHLTQYLQKNKPGIMIQAGIAGCFDLNLSLGEAFVVSDDRFADMGVEENNQWKDIFDMNLIDEDDPPYTNGWLTNSHRSLIEIAHLPVVTAISINEVTTSPNRITQFKQKYNPDIESMEGAAFHYVCLLQGIPFIQLRTISNFVGERDKKKWNLTEALENLAGQLTGFIHRIS
ncbi:MAG TPA: futalosine hydrolase [Chitinophagaceae bacterium]